LTASGWDGKTSILATSYTATDHRPRDRGRRFHITSVLPFFIASSTGRSPDRAKYDGNTTFNASQDRSGTHCIEGAECRHFALSRSRHLETLHSPAEPTISATFSKGVLG